MKGQIMKNKRINFKGSIWGNYPLKKKIKKDDDKQKDKKKKRLR